jgi:hypothetical protein
MTELLEKIKSVFSVTEPGLVIDREFIELRENMKLRLKQGKRNDFKFTKDVDCLMLEEWLIKKNLVLGPLSEHLTKNGACVYDCRIELLNSIAFVDFKCIDQNLYYNISEEKMKTHPWVQEGINKGLLTHYCFYRMHRPEDRPLQENDVVTFELINVLNSQYVLDSLMPSQYEGKYYKVNKYDR